MAESALSKIRNAQVRTSAAGKIDISLDELVDLARDSRRLITHPERVRASLSFGINDSARHGHGMEYAESRPWVAGDDIRNMDWRVTARTGRPHTKLFEEERDQPWMIVVDLRSAMAFGSKTRFKSVQAARIAALLGWAGISLGNRLSGVLLTDSGVQMLGTARGRAGVIQFLQAMASIVIKPERRAFVESLSPGVFDQVVAKAPPSAAVFFISDFSGFTATSYQELSRLGSTRSLIAVRISDALETEAPQHGRYPVTNGEERHMVGIRDEDDENSWVQALEKITSEIRHNVVAAGARFAVIAAHADPVATLKRILNNEVEVDDSGATDES